MPASVAHSILVFAMLCGSFAAASTPCNSDDGECVMDQSLSLLQVDLKIVGTEESAENEGDEPATNALTQVNITNAMARSAIEDLIDVDKMAMQQRLEAAKNVEHLKEKVDTMQPELKAARDKFKAARKDIRENFSKCRKKIKMSDTKWKEKSECKPFVDYFGLSVLEEDANAQLDEEEGSKVEKKQEKEEDEQEDNQVLVEGAKTDFLEEVEEEEERQEEQDEVLMEGRRRKKSASTADKADKKAAKKEKKADKKAARQAKKHEKCLKTPKCELRLAKLLAKQAAKKDFMSVRKNFRDYKKQLRTAKFQKNILPGIIILLKPKLLSALGQVHMGDGATGILRVCTPTDTEDCIPLNEISTVGLLKKVMQLKLNSFLWPHFSVLFKLIYYGIWKLFEPASDAIRAAMTTAVGTIPVVGGALATAVGVLFDIIFFEIKTGVEAALDLVKSALHNKTATAVVNAVFATGLFTTDTLQDPNNLAKLTSGMESAAAAAEKKAQSEAQEDITGPAQAAKSEATEEAQGAQALIDAEGQKVSEEEEADDEADVDEDAEEDELDVEDEDD